MRIFNHDCDVLRIANLAAITCVGTDLFWVMGDMLHNLQWYHVVVVFGLSATLGLILLAFKAEGEKRKEELDRLERLEKKLKAHIKQSQKQHQRDPNADTFII